MLPELRNCHSLPELCHCHSLSELRNCHSLPELRNRYNACISPNTQGKTGQGVNAAGFLPATGTQYKKEAAIAQGAHDPSHRLSLVLSAKNEDPPNNARIAELGQNMLVPGTTAARFAKWARKEGAAPGWKRNGAYYRACVEAITRAPNLLATALGPEAAKRLYLAMVNGDGSFWVLHNLARFEEPAGMRSRAGGCIMVFEGEVRDDFGLPRLLQFDEPD